MKLVRFATIYFKELPDEVAHWKGVFGPVQIETLKIGNQTPPPKSEKRLLVQALVPLQSIPTAGPDGFIAVPDFERKSCETGIHLAADLLAVTNRTERSILSPMPCVALL